MAIQELLGKVAQHVSVGRAFGTAYDNDGVLIIPVALVAGGGGGGAAYPSPNTQSSKNGPDDSNGETEMRSGNNSGGGLGGIVMPVGVYVVKNENVRWIPALNANMIVMVAFMTVRMIVRTRQKSRRHTS